MPDYKKVTLSNPLLSPSQTKFRLGLVRQRTRTYPLDSIYSWQGEGNGCYTAASSEAHAPTGYIPESMTGGLPLLDTPAPDADGLLPLSDLPRPDWMYFDEGATSRCGVEGSAANVSLKFPDGKEKLLRFTPLCYNTSCLSLFDTPIVFGRPERAGK